MVSPTACQQRSTPSIRVDPWLSLAHFTSPTANVPFFFFFINCESLFPRKASQMRQSHIHTRPPEYKTSVQRNSLRNEQVLVSASHTQLDSHSQTPPRLATAQNWSVRLRVPHFTPYYLNFSADTWSNVLLQFKFTRLNELILLLSPLHQTNSLCYYYYWLKPQCLQKQTHCVGRWPWNVTPKKCCHSVTVQWAEVSCCRVRVEEIALSQLILGRARPKPNSSRCLLLCTCCATLRQRWSFGGQVLSQGFRNNWVEKSMIHTDRHSLFQYVVHITYSLVRGQENDMPCTAGLCCSTQTGQLCIEVWHRESPRKNVSACALMAQEEVKIQIRSASKR